MKYGFVQPFADPHLTVECAHLAEQAGWDALFVWEPVWGIDAWVSLGAASVVTERIRLGTMITPLSRMRPWKLASETLALDHLSNGRVILAVGLGAIDSGFEAFGEVIDRKTRAELLDEGLEILTGLWAGKPFEYEGKHYQIRKSSFFVPPPTVQQPRIPIWVVGAWPLERSMRRVLRYDGILPNVMHTVDGKRTAGTAELEDIRNIAAYLAENRPADSPPIEIIVEGETPGDDQHRAADTVREWAEAGATWWIEARWSAMEKSEGPDQIRRRVAQGPPRI